MVVQPNLEPWHRELLALAEETERLAHRIGDAALSSRLREIAAEVRQLAQQRHGGFSPPASGAAEPTRWCCLPA